MKYIFSLLLFCSLVLTGCGQDTAVLLESPDTNSGATQVTGKEFSVFEENISDDDIVFSHASGATDSLYFTQETTTGALDMQILFPDGDEGNYRLSQIIMPDASSDGPFGLMLNNYPLSQSGNYQLIFSENSMVWEPFSGNIEIQLSRR